MLDKGIPVVDLRPKMQYNPQSTTFAH